VANTPVNSITRALPATPEAPKLTGLPSEQPAALGRKLPATPKNSPFGKLPEQIQYGVLPDAAATKLKTQLPDGLGKLQDDLAAGQLQRNLSRDLPKLPKDMPVNFVNRPAGAVDNLGFPLPTKVANQTGGLTPVAKISPLMQDGRLVENAVKKLPTPAKIFDKLPPPPPPPVPRPSNQVRNIKRVVGGVMAVAVVGSLSPIAIIAIKNKVNANANAGTAEKSPVAFVVSNTGNSEVEIIALGATPDDNASLGFVEGASSHAFYLYEGDRFAVIRDGQQSKAFTASNDLHDKLTGLKIDSQ